MQAFRQEGQTGVFLNEPLVFHFDAELERSSVTPVSLRVVGPAGKEARGKLEVQGSKVLFVPDIPRSVDLADGGLLPGARYIVTLSGFPNPDGIRARSGAPLASTRIATFETITAGGGEAVVFVDDSPDRAEPLRVAAQELGPLDPIEVLCAEPVDPRTLVSEDFVLWQAGSANDSGGEVVPEEIPLRASLRENSRDGSLIELRPIDSEGRLRSLDVGEYQLYVGPEERHLRDFGGHLILPVWVHEPRAGFLSVREPQEGRVVEGYVEEFLDERRRSPAAVDGAAGTALWGEGLVSIRLPAAVGDGRDGVVRLEGAEPRSDVQAVELSVGEGTSARLTAQGLVVLRTQGRLEIDGALVRDVEGVQERSEALGHTSFGQWKDWLFGEAGIEWNRLGMTFEAGQTLSHWLDRAREEDSPWTVLIAGGDLVVNGVLWTDGPILLVAGGWIRVSGEIRSRPGEYWALGDGSVFSEFDPMKAQRAPLLTDRPGRNPLASPQVWSVLSAPIRPTHSGSRWLQAVVRGEDRAGTIRVRYLGERDLPGGGVELVGPVDSPILLEDCEVMRLRIDLAMSSTLESPLWKPPIVDAVELTWDQGEAAR